MKALYLLVVLPVVLRGVLIVASIGVLSGCTSTPQSRQIQSQGLGHLPVNLELTQTPFFAQTQYQCGPAALATVLQTHGVAITPEELATQVYLPDRQGSLQIEMTVAARRQGMLAFPLRPKLVDLFTEVAAGNPVLVLQNLAFDWYPQWHFAVVIGYDTETADIILRSGTTRRWVTPIDVFERTWQRADYWALAIVPIGEMPSTAELLPYLNTAYAFEETGNLQHALDAYSAATVRWPKVAATWTALGNMQFALHNWLAAVSAFQVAARLEPDATTGWNNLAYALHTYGCGAEAQAALQCGLNIAPADKNLQDSVRELSNQVAINPRGDCPVIHCQ